MDYLNSVMVDNCKLNDLVKRPLLPYGTSAEDHFEVIKSYIDAFQNTLDSEHEVGLLLTNFGQDILLYVDFVGFENPSLMVFKGFVKGQKSTLIQHVSQLSFLLTAVPKNPDRPKRKIGFALSHEV